MFIYKGAEKRIKNAITLANDKGLLNEVSHRILNSEPFDMSTATPIYLSVRFTDFLVDNEIEVVIYYPKWVFSKAYGYFTKSKPRTIHLNGYKARNMTLFRMVSLFYHEAGHACDFDDNIHVFNHGSNNPKGKENTFQYSLNRFVNEYFNIPNKKPRKGLWARLISFLRF